MAGHARCKRKEATSVGVARAEQEDGGKNGEEKQGEQTYFDSGRATPNAVCPDCFFLNKVKFN